MLVEEAGTDHSALARNIERIQEDPNNRLALERSVEERTRDLLDNQFAKKAPRTMLKRAGHVAMYIRWCKGKGVTPCELAEERFVAYGDEASIENASATRVESVRQALSFACSVLELDTPPETL